MNTIRRMQDGEPALYWRSLDGETHQSNNAQDSEALEESASVVGGSGTGKDGDVNAGELAGEETGVNQSPSEVRAVIVAGISGNADGAKGGRKANASSQGSDEIKPPIVPERDKQGGEAAQLGCKPDYGAERRVWSEKMLVALQNGSEETSGLV